MMVESRESDGSRDRADPGTPAIAELICVAAALRASSTVERPAWASISSLVMMSCIWLWPLATTGGSATWSSESNTA
jgi:hypothetical protein